jgi:hypothetical protein
MSTTGRFLPTLLVERLAESVSAFLVERLYISLNRGSIVILIVYLYLYRVYGLVIS